MESLLERVWNSIQLEFSDIKDIEQLTQVVVRLCMAAALGSILGYERESKRKAAGLRTHILVALGSALFILIPLQSGISQADLSRVLQGLVAGIGFVGAGSIMHADGEKNSVQGLTTAASIWMTAAIGAAVGMGRDVLAILATLIAYFVLAFVHINDRTWN